MFVLLVESILLRVRLCASRLRCIVAVQVVRDAFVVVSGAVVVLGVVLLHGDA